MSYLLDGNRMILGTCYYPEQWPQDMWQNDLQRMHETGIEVIRIAEFAWNKFEPHENVYDFSFFDRFLDLCEDEKMKVIFCTPSATPPAWLTEKYPEVLNARKDGVLIRHGERRHYNYNSPIYRKMTSQLVEKMAQHYAARSCIIGWQIDNEINCETDEFYSQSDDIAFRDFVHQKYQTLEKLNQEWGTVFWNQTYTDWSEVHVPRITNQDSTNPHEVLDYKRFVSDSACRWAGMQSDILRRYLKPEDFITTNGLFNLDNHRMAQESLDFMTYDCYPNFAYMTELYDGWKEGLLDREWSRNLSEVRSVSGRFGIMEQQSGANGWTTRMESPTPRPGQIRLWTMQSIAHGADYVSYFRWRTSTMGTEIYWHGILDYSSRENRRIREVRQIAGELSHMQEIAGSTYRARVAVVKTHDNEWDAQLDRWHHRLEECSENGIFAAATHTHTPMDYLYLQAGTQVEKLQKYELLIFPHAVVITSEQAGLLEEYVRRGGKLILGCRAGLKNENGRCTMQDLPGVLRSLSGAVVTEFSPVAPDDGMMYVKWENGGERPIRLPAAEYNDLLQPDASDSEVLGVYNDSYYAGTPALIRHPHGKGTVWSYGSTFTEQTAAVFLNRLGFAEPYGDLFELPEQCEIACREKAGDRYFFILNYDKKPVHILLKKKLKDMLRGERVTGEMVLSGYGVMVLMQEG
ncbi:MAG: beta-galactosidase [Butyrivibrio sp.]|jgi:beta-galactosidase|nr:beta-galactosidase [Butyrivibrio sp.]